MSRDVNTAPDAVRNLTSQFGIGDHLSEQANFSFPIVHEKYQEQLRTLYQFLRTVKTLRNGEFFSTRLQQLATAVEELDTWCAMAEKDLAYLQAVPDFSPQECRRLEMGQAQASPELRKRADAFIKVYKSLEAQTIVANVLRTCKALLPYQVHLENPKQLSYDFILTMSDGVFQPLPFAPSFNVVPFIEDDLESRTNKYLMFTQHMLFKSSYEFYQLFKKPDADPEVIRQQFLGAIESIENAPDFSGCKDGFRLLRASVDTYVEGFSTYSDPGAGPMAGVMNFMQDIAGKKLQKKDLKARTQIMKIIRKSTEKWNSMSATQRHNTGLDKMMGSVSSATDQLVRELDQLEAEDPPKEEPAKEDPAKEESKDSPKEKTPHVDLLAPENASALAELMEDDEPTPTPKPKPKRKGKSKAK